MRPALALITLVLVADALVGENGWFERHHEQERLEQKSSELAKLQDQVHVFVGAGARFELGPSASIGDRCLINVRAGLTVARVTASG